MAERDRLLLDRQRHAPGSCQGVAEAQENGGYVRGHAVREAQSVGCEGRLAFRRSTNVVEMEPLRCPPSQAAVRTPTMSAPSARALEISACCREPARAQKSPRSWHC